MNSMAGSPGVPHFDEAALKHGAGSLRHPLARALLALTFTTMVNIAVSPEATVALENVTVPVPPTAGELGVQPLPVVTVAETNVVLAGTGSVTVTEVAAFGPLLMKLIV